MHIQVVVRELLNELFATDAELTAYCGDRYAKACRGLWADGMNRIQKINHLLAVVAPEQLLAELQETHPKEVAATLLRHQRERTASSSGELPPVVDPGYQRLLRQSLVEAIHANPLRPHGVATLLQTWQGGGKTLARQLSQWLGSQYGLSTVWLRDQASLDSTVPEFFYLLTGDRAVRNLIDFSAWLQDRPAPHGLLIVLLGTHGPEQLLSQVAAVVRSYLAAHPGSLFVVVGGIRVLELRQHTLYPWLKLLPLASYVDIPDLTRTEVAQLLALQSPPIAGESASLLYELTGGHPGLLYELIRQRLLMREPAEAHLRYQLSQSRLLERHLRDPQAREVLRKLHDGEEVASLLDPCIRHDPTRPESRLYFDSLIRIDEQGKTVARHSIIADQIITKSHH